MPKIQLVGKQDVDRLEQLVGKLKTVKMTIEDCDFDGIVRDVLANCRCIVSIAVATMGDGGEMADINSAAMTIVADCDTFLRSQSLEKFKTIIRAYDSLRELITASFLDKSADAFMGVGRTLWG